MNHLICSFNFLCDTKKKKSKWEALGQQIIYHTRGDGACRRLRNTRIRRITCTEIKHYKNYIYLQWESHFLLRVSERTHRPQGEHATNYEPDKKYSLLAIFTIHLLITATRSIKLAMSVKL